MRPPALELTLAYFIQTSASKYRQYIGSISQHPVPAGRYVHLGEDTFSNSSTKIKPLPLERSENLLHSRSPLPNAPKSAESRMVQSPHRIPEKNILCHQPLRPGASNGLPLRAAQLDARPQILVH